MSSVPRTVNLKNLEMIQMKKKEMKSRGGRFTGKFFSQKFDSERKLGGVSQVPLSPNVLAQMRKVRSDEKDCERTNVGRILQTTITKDALDLKGVT